jgi:hypothetical protein
MRYIVIGILVMMTFAECKGTSPDENHDVTSKSNSTEYPVEVRNLGAQQHFDKTKWFLYCSVVGTRLRFLPHSKINDSLTTYDQLPLKFDHIEVRNDTVEILFRFVYRGIDINGTIVENPSAWGCVYKLNSTKIIKVVSSGTYRYNSLKCDKPEDCPDMFDAINMENVSQYLKSHKGDVNSWFRNEAIKRGLIKDKIEMK